MIRVLHVIASMKPSTGGPCQVVREMIPALDEIGCEGEVVCLDDRRDLPVHESIRLHALGRGKGPWQFNGRMDCWFTENLGRFDSVIVHGMWLYSSFATWRAVRKSYARGTARSGYWVMPHGMLDPWFQRSRKVKAIRNRLYWRCIENRVVQGARGLLFTCAQERDLARTPFHPYAPASEKIVGLGTREVTLDAEATSESFRRATPGVGTSPFILFMGRIDRKKGVELLIRAYAELCDPHGKTERGYKMPLLVIAGPSNDKVYLDKLHATARECGLASSGPEGMGSTAERDGERLGRIVWLPMLTGRDKWGALCACEAFVLPSHQENFGLSVAEALSVGRPVLISDKVNIWRDICEDGAAIVESDDLLGTVSMLRRWILAPLTERAAMSESARRCFSGRFRVQAAARQWLDVLSEGPR